MKQQQSCSCWALRFLMKNVSHSKKHTFCQLSIFASSFFLFFCFSCFLGCAAKNTCFMHPLGPWACHCGPTLRPPGPGRVNPLHVFPVSCSSHFFDLFDCLFFGRFLISIDFRLLSEPSFLFLCQAFSFSSFFFSKKRNGEQANRQTSQQGQVPLRPGGVRAARFNNIIIT